MVVKRPTHEHEIILFNYTSRVKEVYVISIDELTLIDLSCGWQAIWKDNFLVWLNFITVLWESILQLFTFHFFFSYRLWNSVNMSQIQHHEKTYTDFQISYLLKQFYSSKQNWCLLKLHFTSKYAKMTTICQQIRVYIFTRTYVSIL